MITKERRLSRFILILMAASGLMAGTAHADELKGMELAEQIAETAEAAVDSAKAAVLHLMESVRNRDRISPSS